MKSCKLLLFFIYLLERKILYVQGETKLFNGKCLFLINNSKILDFHLLEK